MPVSRQLLHTGTPRAYLALQVQKEHRRRHGKGSTLSELESLVRVNHGVIMRMREKWAGVVGGVLLRLRPEYIELLAFGGDPHLPSPHRTDRWC